MVRTGERQHRVHIELTWGSILKVVLTILLVCLVVVLRPLLILLLLAVLIAVAVHPMVQWICRKTGRRWIGLLAASLALIIISVGIFAMLGPMLLKQAGILVDNLPKLKAELVSRVQGMGHMNDLLAQNVGSGGPSKLEPLAKHALELFKTTLGGVLDFFIILVLAIYLLVEGPRVIRWGMVFFPASHRPRIRETLSEAGRMIVAYMVGNFITSVLCAVYVTIVLALLHVPMAVLLGFIAGVLDVLPIIGFFLSVFPAIALALTVSSSKALAVFLLYGAYHLVENYFIVPKVYGNKLKLSNLAVLLAIMAGALIAGVPGAIAILPFVAAYPAVERIWLASRLEPDTVPVHEQLSDGD